MKTVYVILKVKTSKDNPELVEKIAGRAYTLDGVEEVTAAILEDVMKVIDERMIDTTPQSTQ